MNKSLLNQFWIYSSLFVAITIDIYVLPEAIIAWKPLVTLLVLIYWNMALPDKVGVFEALLFGILVDLSTGSILGLHAVLFVLITYICQRFFYQFRVSPLWQQSVTLFLLFFIFRLAFAFDFKMGIRSATTGVLLMNPLNAAVTSPVRTINPLDDFPNNSPIL